MFPRFNQGLKVFSQCCLFLANRLLQGFRPLIDMTTVVVHAAFPLLPQLNPASNNIAGCRTNGRANTTPHDLKVSSPTWRCISTREVLRIMIQSLVVSVASLEILRRGEGIDSQRPNMEGTCLCKAVTVKVNDNNLFGEKRRGYVSTAASDIAKPLTSSRHLCHCLNCKKVAGSLFGTNLIIEEEKVNITGEGT